MPLKTIKLPIKKWEVTLGFDFLSHSYAAGTLSVKSTSSSNSSKLSFWWKNPSPATMPMVGNLQSVHPQAKANLVQCLKMGQQFVHQTIDEWYTNHIVLDNPSATSNIPIGLHLSNLVRKGHIRMPCIKRGARKKQPFLCKATVVNRANVTGNIADMQTLVDTVNSYAQAAAIQCNYNMGTFGAYLKYLCTP